MRDENPLCRVMGVVYFLSFVRLLAYLLAKSERASCRSKVPTDARVGRREKKGEEGDRPSLIPVAQYLHDDAIYVY